MSMKDRVTGRIKQAAGDLLGDRDLHRQGAEEERKGEAKEELERRERRLAAREEAAAAVEEDAERRAAEAARREFERADEVAERQEERVEEERILAERKAAEVEDLERRTDAGQLADTHTRGELYERAAELGVEGRSGMTKEELAEEVRRRE